MVFTPFQFAGILFAFSGSYFVDRGGRCVPIPSLTCGDSSGKKGVLGDISLGIDYRTKTSCRSPSTVYPRPLTPTYASQYHLGATATKQSADKYVVNEPWQFEDVKYYLKELFYEEPVWIGLRRNSEENFFKWTDDTVASPGTDQLWKIKPTAQEDPQCVMSSPFDAYHWTGRRCNGPDVASFICEMPVPDWVQKSYCTHFRDENVTVTFHPQIKMVTAAKACENSDVKYIECHDSGEDNKAKERAKLVLEGRLNCSELTPAIHESSSSSPSTKIIFRKSSTFGRISPPMFPVRYGDSFPLWEMVHIKGVDNSSDYELNGKTVETTETSSEPSTSLPQEMSFAEEPIKASKPFEIKESTEQPEQSTKNEETTSQIKFSSNNINFIPTAHPEKAKSNRSSIVVEPTNSNYSEYSSRMTSSIPKNTTNEDSPSEFTSSNSTVDEESHEVFNNDKNLEAFQSSSPSVEKSVVTTTYDNKPRDPKLLKDMIFDGSDEESISARTYNIEGTFISNDFINVDPPITMHKKIDLTSQESKIKETTVLYETTDKPSSRNSVSKLSTVTESTVGTRFTTTAKISSSGSTNTVNTKTSPTLPTTIYSLTEKKKETSTQMGSTIKEKEEPDLLGNKTEIVRRKIDPGLPMTVNDYNDEKKLLSRKRQIYTERHSFYPYFLGRILG